MKKKRIFKIVGASIAGIILILTIAGVVHYKTTVSPMVKIMKNGHPSIANDKTLEMHYCKNEVEETAVITKIITDKYGKKVGNLSSSPFFSSLSQESA